MEDRPVFDPALLWFVVGLALALAEMAAPGVILIFFGLGAWIVALTTWAGLTPGLQSQLLVFALASTACLVGLRRWIKNHFYGHVSDVQDPDVNLDEFTGRPVEVVEDLEPGRSDGRVEFKGASWRARSSQPIARGARAVIEEVDGLVLVVRKAEEELS